MVWGGMSTAGVGPICFLQTNMSLLLSIKKSWSIFCFGWLSNCLLEVMNSHSNTTWLLPIMPNPLGHGLPHMRYRFCLGQQTLWILIPSKIYRESQSRGWLLVDQLLWSSWRYPSSKLGAPLHLPTVKGWWKPYQDELRPWWLQMEVVLLSTEDFSKLLKVHVYRFICFVLLYCLTA